MLDPKLVQTLHLSPNEQSRMDSRMDAATFELNSSWFSYIQSLLGKMLYAIASGWVLESDLLSYESAHEIMLLCPELKSTDSVLHNSREGEAA